MIVVILGKLAHWRKIRQVPVLWLRHPDYAGSPSLYLSDWLNLQTISSNSVQIYIRMKMALRPMKMGCELMKEAHRDQRPTLTSMELLLRPL